MSKEKPKKQKNLYIWLFGILLAFVLLHLYIFTKNITLKYEVVRFKVKLKELKSENRFLSSKLSAAEALPKIAQKAQSSLNMYYPEKMNYVITTKEVKQ